MASLADLFEFSFHGSIASLEAALGCSPDELELVARTCDSGEAYRRDYMIVRGKIRLLSVPSGDLDMLQRRINELLFPIDLEMPMAVNGFVAGRSTRSNATPHLGAMFLQKFDIKEFFDNVATAAVRSALQKVGFGPPAALILARLVSCKGQLPQGARTSPRISNIVLADFDAAMFELVAARGINYTRFADDLSFSGVDAFDIENEVETTLAANGFELNPLKSKSFKHGQPMFVTGLSISDVNQVRVRKRLKAQLRQQFYYVERFGATSHFERVGQSVQVHGSRLTGQFHYVRSVEPAFAAMLEAKYPNAYRALVPDRDDYRLERVHRYRNEFLNDVKNAPPRALPIYSPFVQLGLRASAG